MNIILVGEAANHRDRLMRRLHVASDIRSVPAVTLGDASFKAVADTADVVVALRIPSLPEPLVRARLIQVPGAGLDGIDFASLPAGATVCNVFEHEGPIAEFVLMAMLHWSIGLDEMRTSFSPQSWPTVYRARTPHREVAGQTLGLLGYGRIGRAIAQQAKAVGMRVIAVDPAATADGMADAVLPPERLAEMLAQSDFVAIACPLTSATHGALGTTELAMMLPHAVLINVSRAEIADEAALFAALRDRTIAGAYLDVWYQYPGADTTSLAPSSLPFHDLPNVICTPHSCAWTTDLFERRYAVIADNIDRLHAGTALRNVVRPPALPTTS